MVVEFTKPSRFCDRSDLTLGKRYVVLSLSWEDYRILNDNGEPLLFPKEEFDVVDAAVGEDWVRDEGDDGDWYLNPPEASGTFIFEDWHDDDPAARQAVCELARRLTAEASESLRAADRG